MSSSRPLFPSLSRRAALIGLGAMTLAGCHRRSGGGPLRVSITGKGDADARLAFISAGIKPDFAIRYSEFQAGNLVVEALNGGSLDLGSMSEIPPIFAAASPIHSFRQIAVLRGDVNSQAVLVPRGSSIRSLADLKGKRVGYVRATTTHYFLIRMLQSVGLGWRDIEPIAMNVSDGAAAFSQGALDAWAIFGYPIQRAVAKDGARVLKTALGFLSGNYIVTAHEKALEDPERVAQIGSYLKLLRRARDWTEAHRAEWAKIVAGAVGVPLPFVEDALNHQSEPMKLVPVTDAAIRSQQQVADTFAAAGLVPKVDVRPLWDTRFHDLLAQGA
ncbi:ABC transporter substrate-binding protein [Sphingomonas sp. TDK1]|uniref:ABC transporter substrate-binding protein n=1 Tax=Sphingomonas sp. TDK1 TaxID=453247 RepID=UPI0007D9F084|nr:ABC transporter substrate-binding protein [Sphingomonas sp. TDK1]OAN66710.1 aliphatic sulfonate ABC transporter substrate-binding protein [Sphingomonas sp. TDK1]